MRLIFKGKYNGDEETIPHNEHMPDAHKFDEISDVKKFGSIMNMLALCSTVLLFIIFAAISGIKNFTLNGAILAILSLFPHELLHACCFKKEVYFYSSLKNGMLFVTGPETMSKKRFILMCALPNIIFGFAPFIAYLINNDLTLIGSMSVFTIGMGMGDYYNIFSIIKQMPKGARTYMYKTASYWYIPKVKEEC